ncbi:MAG: restriction endonuclease fold toxin [Pseudomonadota bacterium]
MLTTKSKSLRARRMPWWRRCVGYFTATILTLQILLPGIASANAVLTDANIQYELNNDPQFVRQANGAFDITPYLRISAPYTTTDHFYQRLFNDYRTALVGPSYVPIAVGDITTIIPTYEKPQNIGTAFVQARYVRDQVLRLLGRHLVNSDQTAYANEAQQLITLYNNAFNFVKTQSGLKYGAKLSHSREDAPADMIWPEKRIINGKTLVVPIVYLTAETIDERRVDERTITFNGVATFRNVDIENTTVRFGRNGMLQAVQNITNTGGQMIGEGELALVAGGVFSNLSGIVQSQGDLTLVAQHIENRTLVHRYDLGNSQKERFGEIADISSVNGDVTFQSYGDIVLQGANVSAGGGIRFSADGSIYIGAQRIVNTSEGARDGWREFSESSVSYLQSRISAQDTIQFIAGNEILIDASEIVSDQGHIELLANLGVTVQDQQNITQYARKGKFGKTSKEESAYRTVAMRALLDAGKGITIHSELGDITLKAAEIISQDGANVTASHGQVNLLVTKENDHYSYSSVKESLFTTTTINRGRDIENVVHTTIVGGLKVDALKGLNVEYEGQFDEDGNALNMDAQIDALSQMPGLEWMGQVREEIPDADWTAIEAKYEEWNEKNRSLSPAFAAVISIAIAIASGGVGTAGLSFWQAALNAGVLSLESQLIMAVANGAVNGDIGGAMEDLASSDTLRSLAVTMVTAGATNALGDLDFFQVVKGQEAISLQQQIAQAVTNATVSAGVSSLILDGDLDNFSDSFVQSLGQQAINTLGKHMAKTIGDAFDIENAKSMQTALKYISHAASGCVLGTANDGLVNDTQTEAGKACAIGAGSAVIGEFIGSQFRESEEIKEAQEAVDNYISENSENLRKRKELILLKNPDYTEAQVNGILQAELSQHFEVKYQSTKLNELAKKGVDIAKFSSAIVAFAAGASSAGVNYAAEIGEITAENNALWLVFAVPAILTAIDVYLTGQEIIEVVEAYQNGNSAKAQDLLIEMGVGAAVGAFVPGDKILESVIDFLKKNNFDFGKRFNSILEYVNKKLAVTELHDNVTEEMRNDPYHPDWKNYNGPKPLSSDLQRYSGNLVKENTNDPHANALAEKLKGESSVSFSGDIDKREFDVISNEYIGQAKPASITEGSKFRNQAKATFEAAIATNKKVYYHFQGGNPEENVIKVLQRYSKRYGVEIIIDNTSLNF